jgi:hypothetical protein
MRTDYKFWYIKRDDDGYITEVAVRFYEGDYVNKKYIRTKRLQTINELGHLTKEVKGKKVLRGLVESNGNKAVFYEPADFGKIKTDDELRIFLNKEISKDKGREPVNEQKI